MVLDSKVRVSRKDRSCLMEGEASGKHLSTPGSCRHIKIAQSGNTEMFDYGIGK